MSPIAVGNLVLYTSEALGVKIIGTVIEIIQSGEAYMDPFYRIIWNDPRYYTMDNTVYDMKQVIMWRRCFLEFEST